MRHRYGTLGALVLSGLLMATAAAAQNIPVFPTPPPTSYDDYARALMTEAFTIYQREIGTQRFQFDPSAHKKGVGGMTHLVSVQVSVTADTPSAWAAAVRPQLQPKIAQLVKKLAGMRLMGEPANPVSGTTDTLAAIDHARGIALQMKHGAPGAATGARRLTFVVLGGR